MRFLSRLLLALACAVLLLPIPALAQDSEWHELRTDDFAILYTSGEESTAQQYAGFVDGIYAEIAAIFGHQTATPVSLRLYPSLESYQDVNPLARSLPGIVAHADFRRHEVAVIVPQTLSQTPDEIQNNIRHELTHIVAAELSEDRLNVGFQEGLAQYSEHSSRELETKVRLLRSALDGDRLLPWSALDDRDTVYQDPQVSYPESLSVVAFLIERYSFAKLRDFLTISARSSGYRSALERAFNATPDALEQQWRDWLPSYLSGGYRLNALTAYDLSQAKELLRQGRYAEAHSELETAIAWLRKTNQADVLQQAQELLDRSVQGQRAEQLASAARNALAAADYARAAELVAQARQAYADLDNSQQDAVLAIYAERAERGLRADAALNQAAALARDLRYPQARTIIDQAAAQFVALGDRARADQALALRGILDQRQSLLGTLLLLLGAGGIGLSALWRLRVRETEIW